MKPEQTIKSELTSKEAIQEAVQDLHNALLENLEASQNEVIAKDRKRRAYSILVGARERLRGIESDITNNWSIM